MKNTALVLNAVLFLLVGVLFYLHFSGKKETAVSKPRVESARAVDASNAPSPDFKIGYFEWDSVVAHFELFTVMKNEVNAKEEANTREKSRMRQQLMDKYNYYKNREMSQTESEQAMQDLKNYEMELNNKANKLDQDYQELQVRKNNEVKTKIEDYLKEYNKSGEFAFVMAYEPNIIFYKDSLYDITSDLIKGLNEKYPSKKKK